MRVSRAWAALLLASTLSVSPLARAAEPTPEDIAQARSLGEQGQAALDAKKFPDAEKLFTAAAALYPVAPTLPLGAARAQAGQGKFVQARETYNRIVREGEKSQGGPAAFKAAIDAARTEGDAAAAKIASVTISVDGPKDAKVTLDDATIPSAAWGLPRPIDPGPHKLQGTASGYKAAELTFNAVDGAKLDQKITFTKDDGSGAEVKPPKGGDVQPPPDAPKGSSRKMLGYGVGGVGVVGVILGSVTGIVAISDKSSLSKNCTGTKCPPSQQGAVDGYNTMGMLSTVGFIVGGVGLAAGAVIILTAPKEPKAAFVSPYVAPGEVGLTGRF